LPLFSGYEGVPETKVELIARRTLTRRGTILFGLGWKH